MLDDSSARTTTPRRIWVAPMVAAVLGAVVAGGTVGGVMQGRISDARDAAIAVETAAHESLEAVEGEAREARYERDSLRRSLASVVEARDAAFEEAEAAEGKLDEKDAEIKRLKREVAAAPEKSTASEPSDETDRPRDVTKAARAAAGDHVVRAVEDSPGHVVVWTDLVDPRGDDGSPAAQAALAICESLRDDLDVDGMRVQESDETTFVVLGDAWGPDCTEV